jgi:hypothetical protein
LAQKARLQTYIFCLKFLSYDRHIILAIILSVEGIAIADQPIINRQSIFAFKITYLEHDVAKFQTANINANMYIYLK